MASLSTIYGVTIVLGSVIAIGAAFLGNYVYPISPPQMVEVPVENTEQTLPANPSVTY
jgi:hypothetical protein